MKKIFGAKKSQDPPPSIQDATDRIYKRGDTVDDKIKKLDAELARYKEQIKKTRPGPAQEAVKARAMRILKQRKMYEGQRDMLYNQTYNLDQVAFASEGIKDAQQTELDALEADMDFESNSVPSYLQPDKETDLDSELNLPAAPSGHAAVPANRQQEDELGLPTVPHASIRT
ncbi:unnamed protein product [Triticum turgidum subsp. durum]|uniref:Charged multivesicular body protein 5 n=1 Tax=Triticum turgidum subsp. durum TaxID=4567 RepID=A0A9R0QKC8_TRITD|nr:unnamed protein product [Triticum turgidum subsp. durum]